MANFFRYLLDTEYSQRDDIDGMREQLDHLARSGPSSEDLYRISQRVALLSREMDVVKTALSVLGQALVEVGGLDPAVLDRRIDEAIAARTPAPAAAAVRCSNCGLDCPATQMVGELCKRCLAVAGR